MLLLISLAAGLVLAVVFQLMLTNLGIALGLTVLDISPADTVASQAGPDSTSTSEAANPQTATHASIPIPVTHLAGFSIAATLTGVLFAAALLSAEFSDITSPKRSAIFGLMLWGVYWLLFLWLSTTTLVGIAESILGVVATGGRRLVTTLRQALTPQPSTVTDEQTLLKALVQAISQETSAIAALPQLLAAERDNLVAEICDRTQLTPTQANTVLDSIVPATSSQSGPANHSSNLLAQFNLPSWRQLLMQGLDQIDTTDLDINTLWQQAQTLLQPKNEPIKASKPPQSAALQHKAVRVFDAPLDETVTVQNRLPHTLAAPQTAQLAHPEPMDSEPIDPGIIDPEIIHVVQDRLIAYCRYTNLDALTPEGLIDKVQTQFDDHSLEPAAAGQQLDLAEIETVITRRNNITTQQQRALINALQSLLATVPTEQNHQPLLQKLEGYLRSLDGQAISLDTVKTELMHVLNALEPTGEVDWTGLLSRVTLPHELRSDLLKGLKTAAQSPVNLAQKTGKSTQSVTTQIAHQISAQLSDQVADILKRQQKPAFHPKQISNTVGQLIKNGVRSQLPNLSLTSLPDLSLPDTHAWKAALASRRDLSAQEVQAILEHTETAWHQACHGIQRLWLDVSDKLSTEAEQSIAAVRSQVVDTIEAAQQKVQAQAEAVQKQADVMRQQVAIAAWWLFMSLLTSGLAAASAGWLASQY